MNHDGLGKPVCVCVCVSGAVKIRINILNRMFLSLNRRIQDTFFFSLFTYDTIFLKSESRVVFIIPKSQKLCEINSNRFMTLHNLQPYQQ